MFPNPRFTHNSVCLDAKCIAQISAMRRRRRVYRQCLHFLIHFYEASLSHTIRIFIWRLYVLRSTKHLWTCVLADPRAGEHQRQKEGTPVLLPVQFKGSCVGSHTSRSDGRV